jgi:hypothetical protein
MKPSGVIALILLSLPRVSCGTPTPHFREGDVVFLVSPTPHTDPVLLATKSRVGHVGMILRHNGEMMFYEAVSPVKYTPLETWKKKQEGKHFVVKRLLSAESMVTGNLARLDSLASTFEGKPYDSWYGWSDEKLYCSELVWKLYDRILGIELCNLRKMKDYDLTPPEVQKKLKERFPDGVPLEETVVAPEDLYQSTLLTTIYEQ